MKVCATRREGGCSWVPPRSMGQPTLQARPGASLVALNRLRLLSRKPTEADAAIANPRHHKYLITAHCLRLMLRYFSWPCCIPRRCCCCLISQPLGLFGLWSCWRRGFGGLACGQRLHREPPTPTPRTEEHAVEIFKSLGRCHLLPCRHVSTCSFLQTLD